MFLLVYFGIFYAFLFVGAVLYLILIPAPRTRRYALSSALWVVAFGSCMLALLTFGGLAAMFQHFGAVQGYFPPVRFSSQQAIGWTYIAAALLGAIVLATGTALLHQILIHRFTFFLFRLYSTAVSAGIGITLTIGLSWWMLFSLNQNWASALLLLAPVFAALLGTFAYRSARTFRGSIPERFPWVTPKSSQAFPRPENHSANHHMLSTFTTLWPTSYQHKIVVLMPKKHPENPKENPQNPKKPHKHLKLTTKT